MSSVLITGGTGYMGHALIPELLRRGHSVHALVRAGSERKLAAGARPHPGNPLDASSVAQALDGVDSLVHLVGVPHPSPAKAREFRQIDLVSIQATVLAAAQAGLRHLVYVSVAQPAPVMKAYQEVRAQGETLIREAALNATILRPWYVLGPGHRWPIALVPAYWCLERIPATRESAVRLGLVRLADMVCAIASAVDRPAQGIRLLETAAIRSAR